MNDALKHISTDDLKRYHMNQIRDPEELATVEEHLLRCVACVDRAEATARFIKLIRAGLVRGTFEVELLAEEHGAKGSTLKVDTRLASGGSWPQ